MKNKKILILIIIVLIIILITIGVISFVNYSKESEKSSKKTSSDKKEEKKLTKEEIEEIYGINTNDNSKLAKKHCLDGICITDLKITDLNGIECYLSANVKNETSSTITDKYIVLKFSNGNENYSTWYYISKLDSNEEFELQLGFSDSKVLTATDYEIVYAEGEELENYKAQVNNIQ